MQPVVRPTVRVLLIDEADRVLMFRHEGWFRRGDFAGTSLWAPPGGGVEPGEAYEAAARRELWEETGLAHVEIGPCVWLRDAVFDWNGSLFDARERYHVCRVPHFVPDTSHQDAQELAEMAEHRWWTLAELIAAPDQFFVPENLAKLLEPIFHGDYPDEPLQLGI